MTDFVVFLLGVKLQLPTIISVKRLQKIYMSDFHLSSSQENLKFYSFLAFFGVLAVKLGYLTDLFYGFVSFQKAVVIT